MALYCSIFGSANFMLNVLTFDCSTDWLISKESIDGDQKGKKLWETK